MQWLRRQAAPLCVVTILFVASVCCATPPAKDAPLKPAAKAALNLARHYYQSKDFGLAAKRFLEAFAIDPRPAFIYNAARAQHQAMELEAAERSYVIYLGVERSDSPGIARAEQHLREVRLVKSQLAKAKNVAPKPQVVTPAVQPTAATAPVVAATPAAPAVGLPPKLLTIGGTVLALTGGALLLIAELEAQELKVLHDDVRAGQAVTIAHVEYEDRVTTARIHRTLGGATMGLGLAAGVLGGLWWAKSGQRAAVSLTPRIGGMHLTARMNW